MTTTWRGRQKADLGEHLYRTALGLFRNRGYSRTSVQQITTEARVAKGTFFNHFPGKDHVLAEWYRRLTLDALAEVRRREFPGSRERILALVDSLARRAAAEPDLWDEKARSSASLLVDEEGSLDDEISAFCSRCITAGQKTGEFPPELDADFFAQMVVTVLTGTGQAWVVAGHGFDLPEAAATRVAFLFGALHGSSPAHR